MLAEGKLTIDLSAIRHNWLQLQAQLEGADTGAVLKADAYGLGGAQVARTLYQAGCRRFFVATVAEGCEIRRSLPLDAWIYIFGGVQSHKITDCIALRLVPVLTSLRQVERWESEIQTLQTAAPFALKIDTGMTRLGLGADDWRQFLADPERVERLPIQMLIGHLACADQASHPLNRQQLSMFTQQLAQIQALKPDITASLANSAGIFLGKEYHFDLVRPGLALFGGWPCDKAKQCADLKSVVNLSLPVIQARCLEHDEWVGYGGDARICAGSVLVAVAGGYADGLLRSLSPNAVGYFEGQPVPIVGRISMDSCVFDLSRIPNIKNRWQGLEAAQASIELLGEHQSVDALAQSAGTVSYEILTSLRHRYHRDYIDDEPTQTAESSA